MCPRYLTFRWKNLHFSAFNFSPNFLILSNTASKCLRCSSKVSEKITISSRYTRHIFMFKLSRTRSISRWKVAGLLVNPKGKRLHSKSPKGPTVKAVQALWLSSISTCQYPVFKSRVLNHCFPCNKSRVSSILGMAYASFTVR